MGAIYIGGQTNKKSSGIMWKIYLFLFLFLAVVGTALKLSAPMLVEKWINHKGAEATGYAFSIRDVELSLAKGQIVLMDVKIFNPQNSTKLLEVPNLTVQLDLQEILVSPDKKISIFADKVDLILSKDLSSEMQRIQAAVFKPQENPYLKVVEAKIARLNLIEQKEDVTRNVMELLDVQVKVNDVSLLSINNKTEFSISSKVADGGKFNLTGKTIVENGVVSWGLKGSLKQVPADIFNKLAGDKLPFSFSEPKLDAEIAAVSEQGKVSGEFTPDIKRLTLIEEKPGIPTQNIARMLSDELTFSLPFTLQDELTLQYVDTYKKLKAYRKYPGVTEVKVTQVEKPKKGLSFWPF
jgi:hypothetical protein